MINNHTPDSPDWHPKAEELSEAASQSTINRLYDTIQLRLEIDGGDAGFSGHTQDSLVNVLPMDVQRVRARGFGGAYIIGEIIEFQEIDGVDVNTEYMVLELEDGTITLKKKTSHEETVNYNWQNIPKNIDGTNAVPDSFSSDLLTWMASEEFQEKVTQLERSVSLQVELGLDIVNEGEALRLVRLVMDAEEYSE